MTTSIPTGSETTELRTKSYVVELVNFELVKVIDRMTERVIGRGYSCGSVTENISIAMIAKRPY